MAGYLVNSDQLVSVSVRKVPKITAAFRKYGQQFNALHSFGSQVLLIHILSSLFETLTIFIYCI